MKKIILLIAVAAVMIPCTVMATGTVADDSIPDTPTIEVEVQFYDISETPELHPRTKVTRTVKRLFGKKITTVLFDDADLVFSDVTLTANGNSWSWDGEDRPPESIDFLSALRVTTISGQEAEIRVIKSFSPQYFEKLPDGLFEVRKVEDANVGISVKETPVLQKDGMVIFKDLEIKISTITEREPIEGVTLNVGYPIVDTQIYKISPTLNPNQYYGLLCLVDDGATLLLKLRANLNGHSAGIK